MAVNFDWVASASNSPATTATEAPFPLKYALTATARSTPLTSSVLTPSQLNYYLNAFASSQPAATSTLVPRAVTAPSQFTSPTTPGFIPTIPDPAVAPTLAQDTVSVPTQPLIAVGTYFFKYAWGDVNGNYTHYSPAASLTADGAHSLSITMPATPGGAKTLLVATDNGFGADYGFLTVYSGGSLAAGIVPPTTYLIPRTVPQWPGYVSVLLGYHVGSNATGTVVAVGKLTASLLECTGVGLFDSSINISGGAGFFGHDAPTTQPLIAGNVTTGTLAQLQTVVDSLLTILDANGSLDKDTT